MAALAVCAVTAAHLKDRTDTQAPPPNTPDQPPPPEPGMIPLTVPEIKRLLANRPAPPETARPRHNWRNWRRRHQARARWSTNVPDRTGTTPWSPSNWRLPY